MRRPLALLAALAVALLANIAHAATSGSWTDCAASSYAGGNGTEADPFLIATAEQLALLAKSTNEDRSIDNDSTLRIHFALTSDIDLGAHYWTPIGEGIGPSVPTATSVAFRGHFDGRGHVISGLAPDPSYASSFKYTYFGLFGRIVGPSLMSDFCKIKNVVLRDVSFDIARTYTGSPGYLHIGALAGSACNSVISGCTVDASASVRFDGYKNNTLYLGGLVGYIDSEATVSDAYTSGSLRAVNYGSSNVGGLAAYCGISTTISSAASSCNTYSESTYDGGSSVRAAGLVAHANDSDVTIAGSFATGDVIAVNADRDESNFRVTAAGGLVGECNGKIEDCFATGNVRSQSDESPGSETYAGGLVGKLANSGASVKRSYAYGAVASNGKKIGGVCGSADKAMQVAATTFWRSDAPGTQAAVGVDNARALTTAAFANNSTLLADLGSAWLWSDVDGMSRPQLAAFFPGGIMSSDAVSITPSSVTVTAGETRMLALSALGYERTASLSFAPSSLGGARITQSAADRSRIVVTTEATTTDAASAITVTAPGLPPMKFDLVVTAGGSSPDAEPDDGDTSGEDDEAETDDDDAPDETPLPPFTVITPPTGVVPPNMVLVSSDDFFAHGTLDTASSRDVALLIGGRPLTPTADAIRVDLRLGEDKQAALAARLSLPLDLFGTTRRASDAETADALDASGRAICFIGIGDGAEAYKIVGGSGALMSWRDALERGFITFVDDDVVLACIITNEREARAPYVAGSFIALPDGLFDDRIALLIFPADDAYLAYRSGGCAAGTVAPLLAWIIIIRRARRR